MQQPPQYPYPPIAPPPPPPPPKRNLWRWYQDQSRATRVIIAIGVIIVLIFVIVSTVSGGAPGTQSALLSTPTAQSQPTQASHPTVTVVPTPTPAPTKALTPTPVPSHYPPQNKADLMALAALGDASAIHEFHSESVGLTGACPQPKRLVTVDPKITGKQLAEDLLAYFYQNGLDNPCGSVVFAYHTQAESNADNGYTAGRVLLDTANQDGSANYDPNATGLKYTLTLDTGDALTAQDEIVTYNQ